MTSPMKSFDTSPFITKNVLTDVFELEIPRPDLISKLKALTNEELFEWAHFKLLRASSQLNNKKYNKFLEIVHVIILGIEEIGEIDCEISKRFLHEIRIPCILRLISSMIEQKEGIKGIKLCDYLLSIDEMNNEALCKKKICESICANKIKPDKKEKNNVETNPDQDDLDQDEVLTYDENDENQGIIDFIFNPFKKAFIYTKDKISCCKRNNENNESDNEDEEL